MSLGAALVLRRTLWAVLDFPLILSRLFQKPKYSQDDLETQAPMYPPTHESSTSEMTPTLERTNVVRAYDASDPSDERRTATNPGQYHQKAGSDAPYAPGPARVFLHTDAKSRDHLALTVNKEMISVVQEVAEQRQMLEKHQKLHTKLSEQMTRVKRAIESAEENNAGAENDHDAQHCVEEIERQKAKLEKLSNERKIVANGVRIFKMDLGFTKDAVQAFFEQVLTDANLLNPIDEESMSTHTETDQLYPGNDVVSDHANSSGCSLLDPEDLFRHTAEEKLAHFSQDVRETQEQFDTWPNTYEEQRETYEALLAQGDDVPARSEFDRIMLAQEMRITSYLINVEKEKEQARKEALALGVIDEDWGRPIYFNDVFEAESWTNDEEIAHQQTKNWSHVERWREGVSASWNIGTSDDQEVLTSNPPDIDEWEVESIGFAQDSVSVVAHDEYQSKNIRQWQTMVGHR
ncbi:hypothetical protein ACLMJK_007993 [Lecanora helva]